jgi:lipopolysaccharide/colanic/teichoic acid biosynthesis glycosyltransferase
MQSVIGSGERAARAEAAAPRFEIVEPRDPGPRYFALKRLIDVAASAAALLLGLPLWLLIAALIKATSRGPVLYRTTTLGLGGRPFMIYKFRTMRADSSEVLHREWIARYVQDDQPFAVRESPNGAVKPVYKVVGDHRVTPFGTFLRRSGLDEVPQFVNVLRGEMSIVGPRSPRPFEYEHYDQWAKQRVNVLPGITGLYQVTARSTASFTEMVALDLEYARRRSTRLDLSIMVRTLPVMLLGKGGY